MGNQVTKNLTRGEMACPCPCGVDTVDFELALILQGAVDHFQMKNPTKDVRLHINSGNRCKAYNASLVDNEGNRIAKDSSKHTEYKASDFFLYDRNTGSYAVAVHINDNDVADYLESEYPNSLGIGRYKGRTHVDTSTNPRRWDRR